MRYKTSRYFLLLLLISFLTAIGVIYSSVDDDLFSPIDRPEVGSNQPFKNMLPNKNELFRKPFSKNSIWNRPIQSDAVYVNAKIAPAKHLEVDVEYFFILNSNDPRRPLYKPKDFGAGRCQGNEYAGIYLPIPDDLIIPDATDVDTPNNAAAFLLPDGKTLVQVNALARCMAGGPIYGWQQTPHETIDGFGITGGHGGSGLSGIGGSIRLGEMVSSEPIRHALKVNLWCQKYCSYRRGQGGGRGYRWPAIKADMYANPKTYGGKVPGLMMGSLLAIPKTITEESLQLQTPGAKKLFTAFQQYGAYVVDDSAWDAHYIAVENGVTEEFQRHYGYDFAGTEGAFYRDVMKIFSKLSVVKNNRPTGR